MSTKTNIEKLIKLLYALVEEHMTYIEEVQILEEMDELTEDERYERDQLLGAQLIADLKLQDAMLVWVNTNNIETLTVQQRADLFGKLGQFRLENMEDVQ